MGNTYLSDRRIKRVFWVDSNENIQTMKKGYLGDQRIYSAGNVVNYHVDTNINYQEDVDNGLSCLHPTTFTPTKDGWAFVGWKENIAADADVLTERIMESEIVDLYAVFSQNVTVTLYNNSSTPSQVTNKKYYNNDQYKIPDFTLIQSTKTDWNARGWTLYPSAGESAISVRNAEKVYLSQDSTYYGCYERTVKVYYQGNGATSGSINPSTGTAYYHSVSGYTDATIKLALNGFTRVDWAFTGWDITSPYIGHEDITAYAQWIPKELVIFRRNDNIDLPPEFGDPAVYLSDYIDISDYTTIDGRKGVNWAYLYKKNGQMTNEASFHINYGIYNKVKITFALLPYNVITGLGSVHVKDGKIWVEGKEYYRVINSGGWWQESLDAKEVVCIGSKKNEKTEFTTKVFAWMNDTGSATPETWVDVYCWIKEAVLYYDEEE